MTKVVGGLPPGLSNAKPNNMGAGFPNSIRREDCSSLCGKESDSDVYPGTLWTNLTTCNIVTFETGICVQRSLPPAPLHNPCLTQL